MWSVIWRVAVTRIGFWTWIWSTRHWTGAGSGLLISMLEKLSFVWLVYNNGAIDMKMYGSGLQEKFSFKMLGLTFSSKLNWCSYIISVAKTASKKIEALIHSMKFLFLFSLKKGQKLAKMTKKILCHALYLMNHKSYDFH